VLQQLIFAMVSLSSSDIWRVMLKLKAYNCFLPQFPAWFDAQVWGDGPNFQKILTLPKNRLIGLSDGEDIVILEVQNVHQKT